MALNRVLLIGAAGNLGSLVLQYLLASPANLSVKVLSRESSTAKFPPSISVSHVPDDYPHDILVDAFKDIDVIIAAVAMPAMGQQFKFIDAAIAAGVKRYIPTEYGLEDLPDWLVKIRPMFQTKHDVRDYLVSKEKDGLEWTGVLCNMFFDMGVRSGLFQFDWKAKKATIIQVNGKEEKWVATTLDTVALAVVKAIEKADLTKNKILLIQDFPVTQRMILDVIQEKQGPWQIAEVEFEEWLNEAKDLVRGGNSMAASKFTFAAVVTGTEWEGRDEFANGLLELPKKDFKNEVYRVLRGMESGEGP